MKIREHPSDRSSSENWKGPCLYLVSSFCLLVSVFNNTWRKGFNNACVPASHKSGRWESWDDHRLAGFSTRKRVRKTGVKSAVTSMPYCSSRSEQLQNPMKNQKLLGKSQNIHASRQEVRGPFYRKNGFHGAEVSSNATLKRFFSHQRSIVPHQKCSDFFRFSQVHYLYFVSLYYLAHIFLDHVLYMPMSKHLIHSLFSRRYTKIYSTRPP